MGGVAKSLLQIQYRHHLLVIPGGHVRKWEGKMVGFKWRVVRAEKASSFSSKITTDLPLYQSHSDGATFDQYLKDRPRVFQAMFPDKHRSQRLNDEVWRIHMLPLEFLFLSVRPVIDMRLRYKSQGEDYPPGVPPYISSVLELEAIRWELRGVDSVIKPSDFALGVRGALYSDRHGGGSRLKGQMEMTISFVLPPVLALIPEDVRRSVAESVLNRLVENMKNKVNGSLLSDFRAFTRERKMMIVDQTPPIRRVEA